MKFKSYGLNIWLSSILFYYKPIQNSIAADILSIYFDCAINYIKVNFSNKHDLLLYMIYEYKRDYYEITNLVVVVL